MPPSVALAHEEMTAMNKQCVPAVLLAVLFLTGCAGLTIQAPAVSLADIKIVEVGLLEQRFAFKLRIQNPNNVELAITGLSFEVEINGRPFAKGVSSKEVTIPRLEERLLEVTAVSNLVGILEQVQEFLHGRNKALSWRIKGRLLTDAFGSLDFEESGKLAPPRPGPEKESLTL